MRKSLIIIGLAILNYATNAQPLTNHGGQLTAGYRQYNFSVPIYTTTVDLYKAPDIDYLKRSKKQKKVAFILLGAGVGFIATSFIIPKGELVKEGIIPGAGGWLDNDKYKNDDLKSVLGIVGVISGLGSIPFFAMSHKNQKKALKASAILKVEQLPGLVKADPINGYPSVGVRVSLIQ